MQYLLKFPKDVDHMGFGGAKFQNTCLGVYFTVEVQQWVSYIREYGTDPYRPEI